MTLALDDLWTAWETDAGLTAFLHPTRGDESPSQSCPTTSPRLPATTAASALWTTPEPPCLETEDLPLPSPTFSPPPMEEPPRRRRSPPPRGLFAILYSTRDQVIYHRYQYGNCLGFERLLDRLVYSDPSLIRICARRQVPEVTALNHRFESLVKRGYLLAEPRYRSRYRLREGYPLDRLQETLDRHFSDGVAMP